MSRIEIWVAAATWQLSAHRKYVLFNPYAITKPQRQALDTPPSSMSSGWFPLTQSRFKIFWDPRGWNCKLKRYHISATQRLAFLMEADYISCEVRSDLLYNWQLLPFGRSSRCVSHVTTACVIALWCVLMTACLESRNTSLLVVQLLHVLFDRYSTTYINAVPCLRRLVAGLSHRGPGSIPGQSVWDSRWTEWHWDRFFLRVLRFPAAFHTHRNLDVRRTSGRSPGAFRQNFAFSLVGLRCTDSTWQFYDFNISTTVRHNVFCIKTPTYWQHWIYALIAL